MQISISPNAESLGKAAAEQGAMLLRQALQRQGAANLILATGASQFCVLSHLVKESDIAWNKVTLFHLDEYLGLSENHPASFRKYLKDRFVSQLPTPLAAAYWIQGETTDPKGECRRLSDMILKHPIDVAFIGIGENGHLAFNDPPADLITQVPFLVVDLDEACRRQQLGEGWFPTLEAVPRQAISMSIQQILKSRAILCSVPDQRKAEAVKNTLTGPVTPLVPASVLQQHAQATIYLDSLSASLLPSK
jgi:glucosamine-6-phosphate deaminase